MWVRFFGGSVGILPASSAGGTPALLSASLKGGDFFYLTHI